MNKALAVRAARPRVNATPIELQSAGVVLDHNYPEPIVDHKAARERALAAYAKTRR